MLSFGVWTKRFIFAAICLGFSSHLTFAQTSDTLVWRHATSLETAPKYPKDFKHFEYVNPDAPKGGLVRLSASGTFDSLNPIPNKGNPALGTGLIFDMLTTASLDETSVRYAALAETFSYPDDFASVSFRLNPNAKWHDGMAITADDVVYSYKMLTTHNRLYENYYAHVTGVEKLGPLEVKFTFDQKGNAELPYIVGQLLVVPKHWWEANDTEGNPRDISKGTLEVPLGSGPYRISKVVAGRTVEYSRVENYWAKDLPVNVGQNNFETLRYEYFGDEDVRFEAFKGDQVDYRAETTAKNWATGYEFDAVKDGRVLKELFVERGRGITIGFFFNLRREKFQDVRVREALNLAFNYEELNKNLFFGQYDRTDSYFFGEEFASSGLPTGLELEVLQSLGELVPEKVFTTPYQNPKVLAAGDLRNNLKRALDLFTDAGYEFNSGKMINKQTGEQFEIEYILNGGSFEKVALRMKSNLGRIGIKLTPRVIDSSQYVNRLRERDYDLIYSVIAQSTSTGNEQLDYFGSESADEAASKNFAGIKSPAIDALIKQIIFAKNREELVATTRAMDRILLVGHYMIPGWTLLKDRTARWDRFSHPDILPKYNEPAFPTVWWYDEEKAARTGKPQ